MLAFRPIPSFVYLTSAHLVFTATLLLLGHRPNENTGLWIWVPICYFTGWIAEYVGVHGGWLFGRYIYGDVLGPKLWAIPLVIGVNWILVVYSVCQSINSAAPHLNTFVKIVLASLSLVALDYLIEPVAIALDFWTWADGLPPLRNYLGWLLVSAVQSSVFFTLLQYSENRLAPWLVVLQLVFFGFLRLTL